MATIQIDDGLAEEVRVYIETDGIEYPSMKNFVNKAIRDKLKVLTETHADDTNTTE
jgi:hypothetical protein